MGAGLALHYLRQSDHQHNKNKILGQQSNEHGQPVLRHLVRRRNQHLRVANGHLDLAGRRARTSLMKVRLGLEGSSPKSFLGSSNVA